ncbi:MAG: ATP-binding protein [Pseudobdellovibrionaceae bacterium]
MKKQIRILLVEDSEDDAFLLLESIKKGGYDLFYVRVENEKNFIFELQDKSWDVVISDYSLPQFDGLRALAIFRQEEILIPFILTSGTIGEEVAVQAMKAGAQDYIMKNNYLRLVPALDRELADFESRRKAQIELKQKQEELIQAQKMEAIGQLAGGLAHDFNNILGVIGLLAESIERFPQNQATVVANAGKIHNAQEKANKLVRQLLFFGRKHESAPEVLDLNQIIFDIEPILKVALGRSRQLTLKMSAKTLWVKFDRGHLEQVLLNLITNARDALDECGEVVVETDVDDQGYVHIRVRDDGCGMDEKTRTRIFEPFFTTKPVGEGTGLGLSTAFGIVSQHDGKIYVESELGKGSTFNILLRLHEGSLANESA